MKMDFSFLASPVFGWVFIWLEIIIFYFAFLVFHRMVERKRRRASK